MLATFKNHWRVISSAWALDVEKEKERRRYSQTEFLPAALEIIETAPSPAGRVGLWALIVGVFAAILWSVVGRLDVVVVAPGRVIPADRVKVVQPSELGVVRAIHVRDGQKVRAGQFLIDLDPTAAGADDAQARTGLMAALIDRARSRALLDYLDGKPVRFVAPVGVSTEIANVQQNLIATQIQEYEARRSVLVRQRNEHEAELAAAASERRKLQETLPLLDKQLDGRTTLAEKGYYSRLRLYEMQEQRIERVRNIDVQNAAAAKATAAMAGIDSQLRQLRSELARTTVKDLADAQDNSDLRRNEIAKTALRNTLMRLRSPVDGTVQQLAVHTLGGVVEPAQTLMIIVPEGSNLIVDAKIPNKDAGFVRVGQSVRIKVDAFPFTDFGTVSGVLDSISNDAIEDEKMGLVYNARVRIHRPNDDRRSNISLAPGLAVSAEIRTGRRRVIQYLLSPIVTRLDEAGRER